ncbi:hypothetical protein [Proteiniphilum sp. X52]|uniref:hypothetical protein n=1 Tax=Proteiniphilum sp. X52 TaxID=2382159 RepID=UPI000F09A615|nr:hypothetical protein [Proteiniphilum sp. X52]RNC66948.1 hypothetical protein D7D25_01440 [Proteiniphilum sp. X52]
MKHLFTLAIALLVSFTAFSQKTHRVMGWKVSRDLPRNEIKLNLPTTIFSSFPEISYERILSADFSLGGSLGAALDQGRYPVDFAVIPYVRWFFGGNAKNLQKYGAGFFIEANGAIVSTNERFYDMRSEVLAGFGLAIGWKYLSQNNWVGELYVGGVRYSDTDYVGYPRLGISIGKRF